MWCCVNSKGSKWRRKKVKLNAVKSLPFQESLFSWFPWIHLTYLLESLLHQKRIAGRTFKILLQKSHFRIIHDLSQRKAKYRVLLRKSSYMSNIQCSAYCEQEHWSKIPYLFLSNSNNASVINGIRLTRLWAFCLNLVFQERFYWKLCRSPITRSTVNCN